MLQQTTQDGRAGHLYTGRPGSLQATLDPSDPFRGFTLHRARPAMQDSSYSEPVWKAILGGDVGGRCSQVSHRGRLTAEQVYYRSLIFRQCQCEDVVLGTPEHGRVASENRSEMWQAELAQHLAHTQQQIAGANYWPQVVFQGIVEADRQNFFNKGGANWFTAVTLRWNLWNGGETKARVEQARFAEASAEAVRKHADSAIHLEVRKAYLDMRAAAQRVEVASAAAVEAEEAHRIIQNRHQAGLTTVTELLRSEAALAAARTRRLAAVYDHRVAVAALEHAAGTVAADSAVMN